jgi:hypothetical protein
MRPAPRAAGTQNPGAGATCRIWRLPKRAGKTSWLQALEFVWLDSDLPVPDSAVVGGTECLQN